MDTQVRHLPKSQVELTLSLTAQEVDEYFAQVYRELADLGRIPGFRPGKAPRIIIRRFYGADHITGSVWMELVQSALPKALEQHPDLKVIGEPVLPDFDELTLNEGEPVSLAVIVTVYPKATVGELAGVKLLRPTTDVGDEDIDQVVERLRAEYAEWVEVSRAVAPGDQVTADVTIRVDGEERATHENVVFEAAPAQDEEQAPVPAAVLGHLVGQEAVAREEFPEDFADTEMAGKTVEYVAVIKRVQERRLPEPDDAFAAEVGDFETMAELREDIRRRLTAEREREAQESLDAQAISYLLASVDLDLPESLISDATQAGLQELDHRLDALGSSLDEIVEAGAFDRGEIEDHHRQRAILGLEARIALDALIETHKLEPEDQDVQAEIEDLAWETQNPITFVQQAYEIQEEVTQRINDRARTCRGLRWIIESGEIEEVPYAEFRERYQELMERLETQRRERREAMAAAAEAAQQAAQAEVEAQAEPVAEPVAEPAAEGEAEAQPDAAPQPVAAETTAQPVTETVLAEPGQAEPQPESGPQSEAEAPVAHEHEARAEAPAATDGGRETAGATAEPTAEGEAEPDPADRPDLAAEPEDEPNDQP